MMVRPLSSVVSLTPGGTDGMAALENVFVIANKCRTRRVFGNAPGAIQFGAAAGGNWQTILCCLEESSSSPSSNRFNEDGHEKISEPLWWTRARGDFFWIYERPCR